MLNRLKDARIRLHFVLLFILAIIAVITRFFISQIVTFIYYVDSYYYLAQAVGVSNGTFVPLGRGFPFIYFMGYFNSLL